MNLNAMHLHEDDSNCCISTVFECLFYLHFPCLFFSCRETNKIRCSSVPLYIFCLIILFSTILSLKTTKCITNLYKLNFAVWFSLRFALIFCYDPGASKKNSALKLSKVAQNSLIPILSLDTRHT